MVQKNRMLLKCMLVIAIMTGIIGGGQSPLVASTLFQTNIGAYDPRIDLRTDGVIVHLHGHAAPTVANAVRHWIDAGNYPVYRMWFIGSDAGEIFTSGKYDGNTYRDAIEMGRSGNEFWQPGRPYMVPTPEWTEYMRQITREAIDAGAIGVTPEEPLAHTDAVYGEAFKREWERFYGEPWEPPHTSVDTWWKSSKLQSHLYFETVKAVIDEAKTYGSSQGRDIEVILPTHSLLSHAAGSMIYPNGASTRLPGLDGFIGQVWTGPVGWTLGRYEGRQLTRDNGFFDSAWLLYSSFANLTRGSDQRMYLLADPVEDDPKYRWDQYHEWYNQTLVAKLMFTDITDYEVMPWPDRIFLPGYSTGGGSPGPSDYLTQLMVNVQVLSDMAAQEEISWEGGTRGIGVLVGDSLGWQRGGPSSSSMDSFHGLALPLIRHGIPVEVLPIERVVDAGYLDDFHLLLVSYDMWKPLEPQVHDALADWVRDGGIIVYFDGDDPYNKIDEWWRQAGYEAPVEHLFEKLGLAVDLNTRARDMGGEEASDDAWHEIIRSDADYHNLENLEVRELDLTPYLPATHLLVRFEDGSKHDGWGPYVTDVALEIDGEVRHAFQATAGSDELPYLYEVMQPGGVDSHRRFADATGYFTYRFPAVGVESATLRVNVGNNFVIKVMPQDVTHAEAPGLASHGEWAPSLIESLSQVVTDGRVIPTSYEVEGARASAVRTDVGDGAFLYLGVPSALFARSQQGAAFIRNLSAYALEEIKGIPYDERGLMMVQRGAYVAAHALTGDHTIQGQFVDLLDSTLPVVKDQHVSSGESALLYDVSSIIEAREPQVMYASRELLLERTVNGHTYLISAGPWQTRGVIRLYGGDRVPVDVRAYAMKGFGRRLESEEVEDLSHWLNQMNSGDMDTVDVNWKWDEATRSLEMNFDQWHSGVMIDVTWEPTE